MTTTLYPRALRRVIEADLAVYPVVALLGARQVGKSTLGREIAADRGMPVRTLDDRDVRAQALADPEGLLADMNGGGFIDEAQRAPGLFLALKALVDRDQRPGQFLLSGSNQPTMSQAVGDSLLGRAAYRTLRPLTLNEQRLSEEHDGWDALFAATDDDALTRLASRAQASGALDWRDVVTTGGFPRVLAQPLAQRRRLLDDYVEVYSNRDVRELLAINSSERFEQLFRLLAARTGQELNVNGLASALGVDARTVRRWIDALARSFLVETIPAWSRNASQRVIKSPKLYLADVALALAAAREAVPTGFHLETLVVGDALVWRDMQPGRAAHHWRTQSQQEVDLILEWHGRLVPIEIKAGNRVDASDARHLRTFLQLHAESTRAVLLSGDPDLRMLPSNVLAAPWWAVL